MKKQKLNEKLYKIHLENAREWDKFLELHPNI
jgi:hypothetical protein